eukprot:10266392-Prorocentrum_lima.AAC.1
MCIRDSPWSGALHYLRIPIAVNAYTLLLGSTHSHVRVLEALHDLGVATLMDRPPPPAHLR